MRNYPFFMSSDEIKILDALTVAGMSAVAVRNPALSKEDAARVLSTGIAYHDQRTEKIDDDAITIFRGKLRALIGQRDDEEKLGLLDEPKPSDLPTVLRMDWDEDEAILLAVMVSFCISTLGGNGNNIAGQVAAFVSLQHQANRLGQDRFNAMLHRFNAAVRAALPNVDFVSL